MLRSEAEALRFSREARRFHSGLGLSGLALSLKTLWSGAETPGQRLESLWQSLAGLMQGGTARVLVAASILLGSGSAIWLGTQRYTQLAKEEAVDARASQAQPPSQIPSDRPAPMGKLAIDVELPSH